MSITPDLPLIPRKVLFGNPAALNPKISPNGEWLSWLAPVSGVMNVWIAPRSDLAQTRALTFQTERPIAQHYFARTNAHVLFLRDRDGDENYHVYCAPMSGADPIDLTPYGDVRAYVVDFHRENPDLVAIAMNDRDARWHDLYIVDLRTGQRRLAHLNAEGLDGYFLDRELRIRLATSTRGAGTGRVVMAWNGCAFSEVLTINGDDVMRSFPSHITQAGDAWYMVSSIGRDVSALVRIDFDTGQERLVASHEKADINTGHITPHTGEVTAVSAEHIRPEWLAVEPTTFSDIQYLEAQLTGSIAIDSQCDDDAYWIVSVTSPRQPPEWHLFHRPSRALTKIAASRLDLEGVQLAETRGRTIKSRDGLDLVIYLTLPTGEMADCPAEPIPMVLLVHGGPWWRDSWEFNRQVQWYANRGYGVLQVNFRGSTGFGKRFLNAGDREWAGKMHDDLIDAVNWTISERIADPARIAICGASYGGYAAFVGATFTPDMFCCSIPVVGITNLETLLANQVPYGHYFLEQVWHRIGDPRTDEGRALLKARSPLHRVDQIKKPMLIGHGANDVRCKVTESEQIVAAMALKQIPVTYVVYPDEGHGFLRPENSMSFNAIAEAFLARHLGGRCEPVGDDFEGSSVEIRAGQDSLSNMQIAL